MAVYKEDDALDISAMFYSAKCKRFVIDVVFNQLQQHKSGPMP